MLLFAHAGITLGAAVVIAGAVNRQKGKTSWFDSLSRYADIRVLMVGALLPDIIDKPVGQIFFREVFYNGRIFSHTLLFLLLLAVIGTVLYIAKRQTWMFVLTFGVLAHLILDGMWGVPRTILWPLYGFSFVSIELDGWAGHLFDAMVSSPSIYIGELIGFFIVLWFAVNAIRHKQVRRLIKNGRIS